MQVTQNILQHPLHSSAIVAESDCAKTDVPGSALLIVLRSTAVARPIDHIDNATGKHIPPLALVSGTVRSELNRPVVLLSARSHRAR